VARILGKGPASRFSAPGPDLETDLKRGPQREKPVVRDLKQGHQRGSTAIEDPKRCSQTEPVVF